MTGMIKASYPNPSLKKRGLLDKTQMVAGLICKTRGHMISMERMVEKTRMEHRPLIRIMRKLERKGFLEKVKERTEPSREGINYNPRRYPTWKIVGRETLKTAFIRGNGRGQVRDRIWKAMRTLSTTRSVFQVKNVVNLCGEKRDSVVDWILILEHAGYLRFISRDRTGKYWQLIKNPGPARPRVGEKYRYYSWDRPAQSEIRESQKNLS